MPLNQNKTYSVAVSGGSKEERTEVAVSLPALSDGNATTQWPGLSQAEATRRLAQYGYNELASARPRSVWAIAFGVLREPMFLLLLACGSIYFLLGDVEEGLILLSFVFVIIGITFYQERKTERALEALRDLSSPRVLVIREGQRGRINSREVVPGDLIVLAEGDRVVADAVLVDCLNLWIDESLLTGESVPVSKLADETPNALPASMGQPGGDGLPFVYSGTLVVKGRGLAQVITTGNQTRLGKIGQVLSEVKNDKTRLQTEVNHLIRNFAIIGVGLCLVVSVVYILTRGEPIKGILAGLTLAMAVLPEEFPVILTVFLALGAWRISQKRVLTRRVPAIETLGEATVLCTDKTGTLTLNQMAVQQVVVGDLAYQVHSQQSPDRAVSELSKYAILASETEPFDPMERALLEFGQSCLGASEMAELKQTRLIHEYPLSRQLMAMSRVVQIPPAADTLRNAPASWVVAAKGAPEAVATLCRLGSAQLQELEAQLSRLAAAGLRILGVARAEWSEGELPATQSEFDFTFLGLVALADPLRPTVSAAIQECYQAGIRVIMITGDYPLTAQSIGRQAGLRQCERVLSGDELSRLDEAELRQQIKDVDIFARVTPEQKLRLVQALQANGHIVAMTGDGVNDAPALKTAQIGIAMSERGTDVAREAAALVLLNDDFTSIVGAVRLGRRIFDNLRKAMAYTLAVHVPIAGMSLVPVLFGWPLVLLPVHIVFMELVIDPACSIVFEAEEAEADVMKRPPRSVGERVFNTRTTLISILQGVGVLIATLAVFGLGLAGNEGADQARATAFVTLLLSNLGLILVNRSWSRSALVSLRTPNAPLKWVVGGAVVFLGLVLYVPFLRGLFSFNLLHPDDLLICLVASVGSLAWFEGLKKVGRWLS